VGRPRYICMWLWRCRARPPLRCCRDEYCTLVCSRAIDAVLEKREPDRVLIAELLIKLARQGAHASMPYCTRTHAHAHTHIPPHVVSTHP
jgi:hypothetical protein